MIDDHGILLLAGVLDSENPIFVKRHITKINDLDNVQKLNYKISYRFKDLKFRNILFPKIRIIESISYAVYTIHKIPN